MEEEEEEEEGEEGYPHQPVQTPLRQRGGGRGRKVHRSSQKRG